MLLLKKAVWINFNFAVLAQIIGSIALLNNPSLLFGEELYFYGPLRNNLLIITTNLAGIQLVLWMTRYTKNGYAEALLMGLFLILCGFGTRVYSATNSIPLDNTLLYYGLYIGGSHLLYFLIAPKCKERVRYEADEAD